MCIIPLTLLCNKRLLICGFQAFIFNLLKLYHSKVSSEKFSMYTRSGFIDAVGKIWHKQIKIRKKVVNRYMNHWAIPFIIFKKLVNAKPLFFLGQINSAESKKSRKFDFPLESIVWLPFNLFYCISTYFSKSAYISDVPQKLLGRGWKYLSLGYLSFSFLEIVKGTYLTYVKYLILNVWGTTQ